MGKFLIITGRNIAWQTNEADIMQRHARATGVPDNVILFDREGTTPSVQAGHVRDLMSQAGLTRVILVTSSHHSARASNAFRAVLDAANMEVVSAPVSTPVFEPASWWKSLKGAKTVSKEYWQWMWNQEEE